MSNQSNQTSGLQPFFNNRQNFGSERKNVNPMYNQQKLGVYNQKNNYPPQNQGKPYGTLDNVSMENNPSSNMDHARSHRSGMDPQMPVNFMRCQTILGISFLKTEINNSTQNQPIISTSPINTNQIHITTRTLMG